MLGNLENSKNRLSQLWEAVKMKKTTFPNIGKLKNG